MRYLELGLGYLFLLNLELEYRKWKSEKMGSIMGPCEVNWLSLQYAECLSQNKI
jgi:hypothetical protein